MARRPEFPPVDVEARVATYRSALHDSGLDARLPPGRLEADVASLRTALTRPAPPVTRVVTSSRSRRFARVEHVSESVGPIEGVLHEPVRETDGRIDVEASVLHLRIWREATWPDLPQYHASIIERLGLWFLAWRYRRDVDPTTPSTLEELRAFEDGVARRGFELVRDHEERTG